MSEKLVNAVRQAGVVGAGGGGFPTHVKLQAKADTVIANGSECEPLLGTDKAYLKLKPHLVIEGLKLAMEAVGAKQGFIAVKGHYKDVVEAIESSLHSLPLKKGGEGGFIKLALLENYYPAGDEFILVNDVTGRVMPEGGLPLNVGVVVNNVITLSQVAEAASGKPVTRRFVTIAGEVARPCVVSAPIGATYSDLIELAGGAKIKDVVLIDGGPMMGKVVADWNEGIGKTTSGILALPADSFVVQMKRRTLSQEMKRSRSACCQCFRCTDLCPRSNLGHELYPHMTMRTMDYNMTEPVKHITSAFLCSQCGMCEMVACDIMGLSPRRVYAEYRRLLAAKGVKNPHTRNGFRVKESLKDTKTSIPMVLKKIGLAKYAGRLNFTGEVDVKMARVPLTRHAGSSAEPTVRAGDKVRMCDVIATPPAGKLGAVCHASMHGVVTDVNERYVEITSK